jgi:hypothetical protein
MILVIIRKMILVINKNMVPQPVLQHYYYCTVGSNAFSIWQRGEGSGRQSQKGNVAHVEAQQSKDLLQGDARAQVKEVCVLLVAPVRECVWVSVCVRESVCTVISLTAKATTRTEVAGGNIGADSLLPEPIAPNLTLSYTALAVRKQRRRT